VPPYAGAPTVRDPLPVAVVSGEPCTSALTPAQVRQVLGVEVRGTIDREEPRGPTWAFPGPALVLELPPDVFDVNGLREVRDRLRTVAWVARELESRWRTVPWKGLATLLAHVRRIRSLIGDAAIADLSGDFRVLATSDVLVKKHVHTLDPTTAWPHDAQDFSARWQAMTGIERSAWTALVLAAGAQHSEHEP